MISRFRALAAFLTLANLLTVALSGCTTETVEVTRIKILERRVIERIIVTVEVTRIERIVETPKPKPEGDVSPVASATPRP